MYRDNESKTVILLNKQAPLWKALNGGIHSALGLAGCNSQNMQFLDYLSFDQKPADISTFPVILLRAKPGQMINAYIEAEEANNIQVNYFIEEMIGASSDAQREATSKVALDQATILALAFFGPSDQMSRITKKFSTVKESW